MADDASAPVTTTDKKIIQQIEYYFGDMNLPRDRFLQEEMKKDEDGWVPLEVMTKFNRLKILSDNVEVIASALKKSTNDIIEVSDDNTKIRRSKAKPLPENRLEFWQQMKTRTLYVKSFPADSQLDQIMEFFSKYGAVENVLMRRTKDTKRNFKGSVFVTFANRDLAQAFLDAESVKFGETNLIRLFEADYYKNKMEERKQAKLKRQEEKNAAKQQQKDKKAEKSDDLTFVAGRVLHLKNLPEKNVDRDHLKKIISEHGHVDWVDFKRGDKEAFVRITGEENCAEKVLNSLKEKNNTGSSENKVKITDEIECEVEILTGEDEKNYWVKTNEEKKAALERKGNFRKNRNKDRKDFNKKNFNKRRSGDDRRKKPSENGKDDKEKAAKNDDKEIKTDERKPKPAEATKRRAESDASAEPEAKLAKTTE